MTGARDPGGSASSPRVGRAMPADRKCSTARSRTAGRRRRSRLRSEVMSLLSVDQPLQAAGSRPVAAKHLVEARVHEAPSTTTVRLATTVWRAATGPAPQPRLDGIGERTGERDAGERASRRVGRGPTVSVPARRCGPGTRRTRAWRCRARPGRSCRWGPCAGGPAAGRSGPPAQRGVVRGRRAVAAETHGHPAARISTTGTHPAAADHHVRRRAVGNADAGSAEPAHLVVVRVDAVGPAAVRQPADVLEVVDGALAEGLRREPVLVGSSARCV